MGCKLIVSCQERGQSPVRKVYETEEEAREAMLAAVAKFLEGKSKGFYGTERYLDRIEVITAVSRDLVVFKTWIREVVNGESRIS